MMHRGHFYHSVEAAASLAELTDAQINAVLEDLASTLISNAGAIIDANIRDLERMDSSDPKYDRLLLNENRIEAIANDLLNVSKLHSPLSEVLMEKNLDNNLSIKKVRVPIGVIGVIYESRPNVTIDVFSLCFKTKNVVILKGGSDAYDSNVALVKLIHEVLSRHAINKNIVSLMPAERSAMQALLESDKEVDLIIPRGSQQLIDYVRKTAKVPVIETGAGIVHTYIDESADTAMAQAIVLNAKTRRVSVCNALDCVILHTSRLRDLPFIMAPLAAQNVTIYADERAYSALKADYPDSLLQSASDEHFGTEFLDYKIAIKVVDTLDEALAHIATYSSKHSEAIISKNAENIQKFMNRVDAAAVYVNASTAFTDGAQFGLGAEIGISTQKLHARGPMALEELCTYKWQIYGTGQIRK